MPNGKNTLSYKRKVVKESNDLVVGSKSVAFAHQASAGETSIPFNALVQPTRWVESGFNNPNGSTLLSLQLQVFADNIEVSSSAKGYIQKEEYVVKNNGIYFKDFVAEENEVFEVVVGDLLVTGNRLVDMRLIRVEGELADTETDFVIGNQVDVNKEEIIVFRDGIQMFRSDNNDDSGATGNYYYLDNDGDGKASSIRFFEAAVGTEAILVASTGGRVDNPNVSTFQEIEKLAGQIDAVIPTVAALAGVPESNFRAGPNYVDLKNFGDRLIAAESDIDALETNKQNKILTAYIKDVKPSGTAGGTFTSGAWQTRDLNTLEGDTGFVSLSANQFTLQPGKYEIEASAPAHLVDSHKVKLRNITDSTDDIIGRNAHSTDSNTGADITSSELNDTVTLTATKTFEIQHRCQVSRSGNGFGIAASFGVDEIYTQVKITKVG